MSNNNKKHADLHYSSQAKTNKKYHKGALLSFAGMVFYLGHVLQQAQARSLSRDQIIESEDSLRLEDNEANLQLVDHQDELLAEDELLTQLDSQSLESSAISLVMLDDASQLNFEDEILQAEGAITGSSHSSISQLLVPVASEEAANASTDAAASASSSVWTLGWGILAVAGVTVASGDSDDSDDSIATLYSAESVEEDIPYDYDSLDRSESVVLSGEATVDNTLSVASTLTGFEIQSMSWVQGDNVETPDIEDPVILFEESELLLTSDMKGYELYAEGTYTLTSVDENGIETVEEHSFITNSTDPREWLFLRDVRDTNPDLAAPIIDQWYVEEDEGSEGVFSYRLGDPALAVGEYTTGYGDLWFDSNLELTAPFVVEAGYDLTFSMSYGIESGSGTGWDGVGIRASSDGGTTWSYLVDETNGYDYNSAAHPTHTALGYTSGYSGVSDGVEQFSMSLDTFVGDEIQIQWVFASDWAYSGQSPSGGDGSEVWGVELSDIKILDSNGNPVIVDTISETGETLFTINPIRELDMGTQVWDQGVLTEISLASAGLDVVPTSLSEVSNLTSLNVSGNSLEVLPDISGLSQLASYNGTQNSFGGATLDLTESTNLTLVDFTSSGIGDVQLAAQHPLLTNANFGENSATLSPGFLSDLNADTLPAIEYFAIANSFDEQDEVSFPAGIATLTTMKGLYMQGNNFIGEVPSSLTDLLPSNGGSLTSFNVTGSPDLYWDVVDANGNSHDVATEFAAHLGGGFLYTPPPEVNNINFTYTVSSTINELTAISDDAVVVDADSGVILLKQDGSGLSATVLHESIGAGDLLTELEDVTEDGSYIFRSYDSESFGQDPSNASTYIYDSNYVTYNPTEETYSVTAAEDLSLQNNPSGSPLNFYENYGTSVAHGMGWFMTGPLGFLGVDNNGKIYDLSTSYQPGSDLFKNTNYSVTFDLDFEDDVAIRASTVYYKHSWTQDSEGNWVGVEEAGLITGDEGDPCFLDAYFGILDGGYNDLTEDHYYDLATLYDSGTSTTLNEMVQAVRFVEVVGIKEAAVATELTPGVTELFHIDTDSDVFTNLTDDIVSDISVLLLKALDVGDDGDRDIFAIDSDTVYLWENKLTDGQGFSYSSATLDSLGLHLMTTQSIIDVAHLSNDGVDSGSLVFAVNDTLETDRGVVEVADFDLYFS